MSDDRAREKSLVYGPVPSRRLGRSLGVDLVPFKVCTFDCIYCQLGRTTDHTSERRPYVLPEEVLPQVAERLRSCARPDYVTMGGSGEPTLNSAIGRIIKGVKDITDVPVAVLSNGSLFCDPQVRADCLEADVILPDLDAGDEETFRRVNRPCPGLTLRQHVEGLAALRREFPGEIWLEVFLLSGVNDSPDQVRKIARLAARIEADRIQLNTAVRPTADRRARGVDQTMMRELCALMGPNAEVVASFPRHEIAGEGTTSEDVLDMLRRRPCTARDIADGLGVHLNHVLKLIGDLAGRGEIASQQRGGETYYSARHEGRAGR